MPGDELEPIARVRATRAISVDAAPEAVWPWIVQIGFGRAGFYSYDLLDSLGRRSAETIIPELQSLHVGDWIPMGGAQAASRDQAPGRTDGTLLALSHRRTAASLLVHTTDDGLYAPWLDCCRHMGAAPGKETRTIVTRIRTVLGTPRLDHRQRLPNKAATLGQEGHHQAFLSLDHRRSPRHPLEGVAHLPPFVARPRGRV
jgi:hypothetical protein